MGNSANKTDVAAGALPPEMPNDVNAGERNCAHRHCRESMRQIRPMRRASSGMFGLSCCANWQRWEGYQGPDHTDLLAIEDEDAFQPPTELSQDHIQYLIQNQMSSLANRLSSLDEELVKSPIMQQQLVDPIATPGNDTNPESTFDDLLIPADPEPGRIVPMVDPATLAGEATIAIGDSAHYPEKTDDSPIKPSGGGFSAEQTNPKEMPEASLMGVRNVLEAQVIGHNPLAASNFGVQQRSKCREA